MVNYKKIRSLFTSVLWSALNKPSLFRLRYSVWFGYFIKLLSSPLKVWSRPIYNTCGRCKLIRHVFFFSCLHAGWGSFGAKSWCCHHQCHVQHNRHVVQLLSALSQPTMVCLCVKEWSLKHLSPSSRPPIASVVHSCEQTEMNSVVSHVEKNLFFRFMSFWCIYGIRS